MSVYRHLYIYIFFFFFYNTNKMERWQCWKKAEIAADGGDFSRLTGGENEAKKKKKKPSIPLTWNIISIISVTYLKNI